MRLIASSSFSRAAKRILKRNPVFATSLKNTLEILEINAFHPHLNTHRLKGTLKGSLACSAAYDLRIIFEIVDYEGEDLILLHNVGTHDEVY